ncbi:MAG: hypothetical protein WKG07_43440 [Hymenobacter sp.]
MAALVQQLRQPVAASYKSQFVVRVGEHLKVVPVEQVAYFFSLEKTTLPQSTDGRKYVVDYTMEQLEAPARPCPVLPAQPRLSGPAGRHPRYYSLRQLAPANHPQARPTREQGPVLVSREKVSTFKSWLDR